MPPENLEALQRQVGRQHASETVISYVLDLMAVSREHGRGHTPSRHSRAKPCSLCTPGRF